MGSDWDSFLLALTSASSSGTDSKLGALLKLQQEEKDAVGLIFRISKKTEELAGVFSKDPREGLKILRACDKDLKKTSIDSVTAIEWKELFLKTEQTIKDYIAWTQENYPTLLDEAIKAEMEEEEAKRIANEEAIKATVLAVKEGANSLFDFIGGIFKSTAKAILFLVAWMLIFIACVIVRCHSN